MRQLPALASWYEIRMAGILVRDDTWLRRPANYECRIVPAHAAFTRWCIGFRYLIENLSIVGQRQISVREPFRNVKHAAIFRAQLDTEPTAKAGRVSAQVDDHIEDGAHGAAHQFNFLMRGGLIVHPTKRRLCWIEGDVALGSVGIETMGRELIAAEHPSKKAALVRT